MARLAALLLISVAFCAYADARDPVATQEIEYLISSVESTHGVTFVRNGTSYDAKKAASHLRRKLNYAGSHVRTAEDFIRLCASKSSVSGKPYEVRFDDGRVMSSESYLTGLLAEYRKSHHAS
jgi:hypothetical protein